mmetsp:Transcript_14411/g.46097  ORF Transcript_14411/g.46097 Transcript_14411/m.46097 type:complete len:270 (+) Transcript_14411:1019-1828(+)
MFQGGYRAGLAHEEECRDGHAPEHVPRAHGKPKPLQAHLGARDAQCDARGGHKLHEKQRRRQERLPCGAPVVRPPHEEHLARVRHDVPNDKRHVAAPHANPPRALLPGALCSSQCTPQPLVPVRAREPDAGAPGAQEGLRQASRRCIAGRYRRGHREGAHGDCHENHSRVGLEAPPPAGKRQRCGPPQDRLPPVRGAGQDLQLEKREEHGEDLRQGVAEGVHLLHHARGEPRASKHSDQHGQRPAVPTPEEDRRGLAKFDRRLCSDGVP